MAGRLIVIEGVDGSGKTTQLRLLKKYFTDKGDTIRHIHFPRHGQGFFGVMVDEYLNGKFGDAAQVDPHLASVMYACDRFEAKDQINEWLQAGCVVLLDRYVTSNKGHQLGKLATEAEKEAMLGWIDRMEYGVFGVPKPDRVLYLDVPYETVRQLIRHRSGEGKEYSGGNMDGHEKDDEHIKNAQVAYMYTAQRYDYWHVVPCAPHGELLSPAEIHTLITNLL